ncbi:MAG: RNA polymerase sigma factor [Gammaproteobacteria bacterium]
MSESSLKETLTSNGRSMVAELYERYRLEILGFLTSKVATPEQAKDLLQQTFLRVLQRTKWVDVANPRAYLRTVARNVLIDFYRQQAARREDATIEFVEDDHGDDRNSPSRQLVADEYLRHLTDALASLSRPVRVAFVLSRVYGYTYSEVGTALSISPRTVEKHVAKGLAACFRHMNDIETRAGQ